MFLVGNHNHICVLGIFTANDQLWRCVCGASVGRVQVNDRPYLSLFFLLVDWLLNGIVYEKNQLWPNLGPSIVYFFWNLTIVKITGNVIYPGMTWDSFLSVLLAIMAFPCAIGIWYLLCWCTNKKLTKVLRRNGLVESAASFDSLVNASAHEN